MAKKSAVLRDEKRRKMYEKYKAKRATQRFTNEAEKPRYAGWSSTRLYAPIWFITY